jgi:hypothetical protein
MYQRRKELDSFPYTPEVMQLCAELLAPLANVNFKADAGVGWDHTIPFKVRGKAPAGATEFLDLCDQVREQVDAALSTKFVVTYVAVGGSGKDKISGCFHLKGWAAQ